MCLILSIFINDKSATLKIDKSMNITMKLKCCNTKFRVVLNLGYALIYLYGENLALHFVTYLLELYAIGQMRSGSHKYVRIFHSMPWFPVQTRIDYSLSFINTDSTRISVLINNCLCSYRVVILFWLDYYVLL